MSQHPSSLSIEAFNYDLPDERIARFPTEQRDASKLMVYRNGNISDRVFYELPEFFDSGDLLIFNHTRVVQARLHFQTPSLAAVEIFCLEPAGAHTDIPTAMLQTGSADWLCLVGQARKWKDHDVLFWEAGPLKLWARKGERVLDGYKVHFEWAPSTFCFADVLELAGNIPLPPYLKREPVAGDAERYQTVYAKEKGSVAAPTAGLHFTERTFEELRAKGVLTESLTLHVGAGTFKPVKASTMAEHTMHEEEVIVPVELMALLAKHNGNITVVGTTSLRSLESLYWTALRLHRAPESELPVMKVHQWEPYDYAEEACLPYPEVLDSLLERMRRHGLSSLHGETGLLIAPGYKLRMADRLITNFHQPQSTLLLLVSAFIGDDWRKVYEHALENEYRFLSFGDSSLLFKQ